MMTLAGLQTYVESYAEILDPDTEVQFEYEGTLVRLVPGRNKIDRGRTPRITFKMLRER